MPPASDRKAKQPMVLGSTVIGVTANPPTANDAPGVIGRWRFRSRVGRLAKTPPANMIFEGPFVE